MKAKRLFIPAYVRGSEFTEDQQEFPFVITTDRIDSYRTIFDPDGWDFSRYMENPVVFYNHHSGSDDPDNLIGMTVDGPNRVTLEDGSTGYEATVRFEPADVNPKAEKIRKKIISGSIRMASIGCQVYDAKWLEIEGQQDEVLVFTEQELLEWSVVNIGSNPGAIVKKNAEAIQAIRMEMPGNDTSEKSEGPELQRTEKNGFNDVQVARLEIAKLNSQ